ncbi:MAG: prepilin-type N-terminal cleavage/methylation domain-containing protein [Firmicutes bacterium]|nr:prepilin-type N-terminal cleavage/methylation domain-containing protein [Bacillota bacterium]
MKRNKRGFTIVELVIVIAVIAILAAVLIPTFTTLVDRAKRTADLQECKSAYTQMLTQEEYFGSKEAAKRAVFVGGNDYAYLCDDNGDFVDHCYKLKVLNKQGASSELKDQNAAVALPAGDTLIVLTGSSTPQMPCYEIVKFENTFALQYRDMDMSKDPKFQALDGTYVVFDDQFVTKVDVENNTLNTMQISSGGNALKQSKVSIVEDSQSSGYCSISEGGDLNVITLDETKVEKLIGITGVNNMKLLAADTKLGDLNSLLGQ